MERGVFIAIEGSDGSGKATQFNLLSERLKAAGYDVSTFDFPQYDKESSYFVKQYLNGRYGTATGINPYVSSLFYALDRYEASSAINEALQKGHIVICNRYVGSNMAHQGAKLDDPAEQRGFFVWADNLEYQLLGIPRPDISVYLRVPAEVSDRLINKSKTNSAKDQHESDLNFMKKSVKTYDLLCQLFPKDFKSIDCAKDGQILSVPQISNLIWNQISPILPQHRPHQGRSAVVTLTQPDSSLPSSNGVTTEKLSHQFKKSSLLLKLHIERQLRSVEPSGFSVWSDNDYKFYVPQGMSKDLATAYRTSLEQIADYHRQMRQKLEQYYERRLLNSETRGLSFPPLSSLLLPVTPMSAICGFTANLSPQSVRRVCSSLLANDSEELRWSAGQLYLSARQKWPDEFRAPLESTNVPEPLNEILSKLSDDRLPFNSSDNQEVKLLEASPRLEFDLLAESIYPYSNLSLDEITEEVSDWSYQQKYESLKQASADPALLLDKIHYKFDLLTDQLVLEDVFSQTSVKNLQAQSPSPRNGYDVPSEIEDAGIDELYISCFDESLKLFSTLQQAQKDDLTIYSTLLGHKLRWQLSVNASEMKNILDKSGSDGYNRLRAKLRDKLAEVHPLTWEVLTEAGGNPSSLKNAHKNRVKPSRRRKSNRKP